jgi:26S proteasome regulatory subunit N4
LKNDYKELMNGIEKGLHQYHASSSQDSEDSKEAQPSSILHNPEQDTQTTDRTTPDPPFAKVNSITPSGPAQEAGLKVGDKIRNFGPVRWTNHENLQKVAEVVQRSEGVSRSQTIHFVRGLTKAFQRTVLVKIVREDGPRQATQDLELHLTPRSGWGGRGTLGCHLLPV